MSRLIDLVPDHRAVGPDGGIHISGVTADSRSVKPGYLFAALPGIQTDGTCYIPDAAASGASAVLGVPAAAPVARAQHLPFVSADNPRRCYARMAARFHASQPRTVAAVTGTNGKTSVVCFARQIWQALGIRAASLGTLGLEPPELAPAALSRSVRLTTPDPGDLHAALAAAARSGVDHLALEASSHGLAQYRLDGVRLTAAAFTTFGRDHLDYHRTQAVYFAAKARLFAELLPAGASAVLNTDAPCFPELEQICRRRRHTVVTWGRAGDVRVLRHGGGALDMEAFGHRFDTATPLVGDFQAANLAGALALVIACGTDPARAAGVLERVEAAPGRLQRISITPNGAAVYIDYAHTPDALQAALSALRPHVAGSLALVFGCGGDRDPGKRPEMGAVAGRLADRIILTDDNPRSEDPASIRAAVRAACPDAEEIGDRAEAIRAGIEGLAPQDALLIAGKGHETGQIRNGVVRPFDDAAVARAFVAGNVP